MTAHPMRRLGVRFDESVWADATRGFSGRALAIAKQARRELEDRGVALAELLPCESTGPDRTRLSACAKLYLPAGDAPPSQRSYAFVLQLARDAEGDLVFVFIAFGPRHPGPGVRSVYQRAHRQVHGKFPDKE